MSDDSEQPLDLDVIQERCEATPAGPWWWGGNVDHRGDVGLRAHKPGAGVIDIMRTCQEDVSEDSAGSEWDADSELADYLDREDYIQRRMENPKDYLAFLADEDLFVEHGRDLAIFEVARNQGLPDDTPRDHPKVYRGDVVGVRSKIADFIAHSREDVPALVAEVKSLTAQLQAARALADEAEAQLAYIGAGCVSATREELVKRITAVGTERHKVAHWLSGKLLAAKSEGWGEACQALAWCFDNGPERDALPYMIEHNPFRASIEQSGVE